MSECSDQDGPSEHDFHCSCCYELMVDPTTLNCGHNFCRFCLAQWWSSSNKTTCPECRQPWSGFPSTNILLRKTIKKLFPAELAERKVAVETEQRYKKIIDKFEALGQKRANQRQRGSQGQPNRWIVITKTIAIITGIIGVLMFFYDFVGILLSSNVPLVHKPIETWSPEDVSNWVAGLGSWSKDIQGGKFLEMGINGKILKSLGDSDLEDLLSIQKPFERHALLSEIEHVTLLGVKPPTDLWEYKAVFPARFMFLLWGFREFPRAMVIYSFFALHDEVFMPLLLHTSENQHQTNYSLDGQGDEIHLPAEEYVRFIVRVVLMPYYLIGKFAFQWVHINSWPTCVILIVCCLMTASEFVHSRWLLLGGWKMLPNTMLRHGKEAIFNVALHLIIWNFIPGFICNIVFYWLMFVGPFYSWNSLKESFLSNGFPAHEAAGNSPLDLLRVVCGWVWQKLSHRLGAPDLNNR